ncbi:hypothetical protein [Volucribacter amazonae]|uniref:Uncharacterized protein n=1 Tax=Volucribacter amazonae TaxID=256731 RepID=A0A9X4PBT9_9PAST|nr:hypothetical protein [Volucribacter amazonae]MDG6894676.1 hypothetical protein [Volucribacter amazonae]
MGGGNTNNNESKQNVENNSSNTSTSSSTDATNPTNNQSSGTTASSDNQSANTAPTTNTDTSNDTTNQTANQTDNTENTSTTPQSYSYPSLENQTITLDSGNNHIQVEENITSSTISTADGNDNLIVNGNIENATIDLADGNNKIETTGDIRASTITAGDGDDEINANNIGVRAYASRSTQPDDLAVDYINLGEGNNKITVNNNIYNSATIFTGSGDDTLTANNIEAKEINLGDGNNKISANNVINTDITLGDGNNKVQINEMNIDSRLNLGKGDNYVVINKMEGGLYSEGGNNTIEIDEFEATKVVVDGNITIKSLRGSLHTTNASILTIKDEMSGYWHAGDDIDTLVMHGKFQAPERLLLRKHLTNVDIIDLSLAPEQTIEGGYFDNFTYDVYIKGHSGITLDLDVLTGYGGFDIRRWEKTGSQQIEGINYDLYQYRYNELLLEPIVYVEQNINVVGVENTSQFEDSDLSDNNQANYAYISLKDKEISLTTDNNLIQVGKYISNSKITTGDGNDSLIVRGNIENAIINLADGDNKIEAANIHASTITTGDGDDNIWVKSFHGDINVGNGNNQFEIGVLTGTIKSGDGNDSITIDHIEDYGIINLGDGNNTIDFPSFHSAISSPDNVQIITGNGDDILNLAGKSSGPLNVNLGNGNNSINIKDSDSSIYLTTGNGNDVLTITDYSRLAKWHAGEGRDTLIVKGYLYNQHLLAKINNVDIIDFTESPESTGFGNIIQVLPTYLSNDIYIKGNDQLKINIKTDTDQDTGTWNKTGSQQIEGISYDLYQYSGSEHTLYVQENINVVI